MIEYQVDQDGIAIITWNMQNRPLNMLNTESLDAFADAMEKAVSDDAVKGIIVTSGRKEFIVGADITMIQGMASSNAEELTAGAWELNQRFRAIETAGKPVAAAINGDALGGGLEVALACHYRVAADKKFKIGLPESKLGLLPGGGGTQRLPRLIGIQNALPLMLEGKDLTPQKAAKMGIVHKLAPEGEILAEAKRWLLEEGDAVQPWDKKGFKIPGGGPVTPGVAQVFVAGNAMLQDKTKRNYPAQRNIMSSVYEGTIVDIDTGLKIESRYFVNCVMSPEAKNLTRFFFSMTAANKLANRPKGVDRQKFTKVGVLGAGMMGAGIAYVTARAGMDVVLLDVDQAAAEKGKAYSEGLVGKAVKRGRMAEDKAAEMLGRITPTTDFNDLTGCELVIEAVFENRELKADVTAKTEAVLAEDAIFASNTSTLPITGLAEASKRPGNFIGLHFFSPVDKMPLVEIICGKETSDETLARSMDYVQAIRKTPITVNDSRGFYTSRVFATYVREGLALLADGVKPALIENAGKMAGMPVGPLALADEVSMDLMNKIAMQTRADLGDAYRSQAGDDVLAVMVDKLDRIGKKAGKGFYDYPADGKKTLWPGLAENFTVADEQPHVDEVIKRLMFIQSLETVRCVDENVVTDNTEADVGSIMGWGFSPARGGTLSQIDMVGVGNFVSECDRLAQAYGERFMPPQSLRDRADKGEGFYGKAA